MHISQDRNYEQFSQNKVYYRNVCLLPFIKTTPIPSLPTLIYVADCILVEETTELWSEVVTRSLLEYI